MDDEADGIAQILGDIKAALLLLIATNLQILDRLPKIPGQESRSLEDALTHVSVLFRRHQESLRETK